MDKKLSLKELFEFNQMLNEFREIERQIKIKNSPRKENDSEHSYGVTMLAWYIVSTNEYGLNLTKVIKYALVHDLVELYAGDTFFYSSKERLASKKEKEEKAIQKIKEVLPKFSELHKLIKDYENKSDKESRFVYALDKIQPMMNIFQDGGRIWKEKKITLKMVLENKFPKVAADPLIKEYFDELAKLLKEKEEYFYPEE